LLKGRTTHKYTRYDEVKKTEGGDACEYIICKRKFGSKPTLNKYAAAVIY